MRDKLIVDLGNSTLVWFKCVAMEGVGKVGTGVRRKEPDNGVRPYVADVAEDDEFRVTTVEIW